MKKRCPRTGDAHCKCVSNDGLIIVNESDFRVALRKVWTDHAEYTSSVIVSNLPVLQNDANDWINRVLATSEQMKELLIPYLGTLYAKELAAALTEHLKLAAAALVAVRNGDTRAINNAVGHFYKQGELVGALLGSIKSEVLSVEKATSEFEKHNRFVVQLATLRKQNNTKEYIKVKDMYLSHMMDLSDMMTAAIGKIVPC